MRDHLVPFAGLRRQDRIHPLIDKPRMFFATGQRRHDERERVVGCRVRLLTNMRRDQDIARQLLTARSHPRQPQSRGQADDATIGVGGEPRILAREAQAAIRADYANRRRITAAGFTRCARKQNFDKIGFPDIALERRDLDRLRTVGQKRGERFGPIPRIL